MPAKKTWQELRALARSAPSQAQAADIVLRAGGIASPAVPVESLCRDMGVRVERAELGKHFGILDATSSRPVIWVNEVSHSVRQRFTIAHELGHLMLHPLGKHYRDDSSVSMAAVETDPVVRREQEANKFAAALLIPLWMLEPYAMVPRITDGALASRFNVSLPAMKWQLERLL
jgi:Zn-dependent peptidase ImmA (M78 family)